MNVSEASSNRDTLDCSHERLRKTDRFVLGVCDQLSRVDETRSCLWRIYLIRDDVFAARWCGTCEIQIPGKGALVLQSIRIERKEIPAVQLTFRYQQFFNLSFTILIV